MNYRRTPVSDTDVTEPNIPIAKCIIPGCTVIEPGVGIETCQIRGGRRLCYPHFGVFAAHELSAQCSDRGSGPTDEEWKSFVSSMSREAA